MCHNIEFGLNSEMQFNVESMNPTLFFRVRNTSYFNFRGRYCMVFNAVFNGIFSYITAASAPIHTFLE